MKFKVGDEVIVVSGKDKGKKGKLEKVLVTRNQVVVAGVNMYKRNLKPTGKNQKGGIVDIVKPISVANIAYVCPKCKLETRIGYLVKGKEKNRVCKKCNQIVD